MPSKRRITHPQQNCDTVKKQILRFFKRIIRGIFLSGMIRLLKIISAPSHTVSTGLNPLPAW
jgi:hypothetical protein